MYNVRVLYSMPMNSTNGSLAYQGHLSTPKINLKHQKSSVRFVTQNLAIVRLPGTRQAHNNLITSQVWELLSYPHLNLVAKLGVPCVPNT